jgi:hypothetical protein
MLAGRVCAWVEASVRFISLVLDGPVAHINPSAIAESKVLRFTLSVVHGANRGHRS